MLALNELPSGQERCFWVLDLTRNGRDESYTFPYVETPAGGVGAFTTPVGLGKKEVGWSGGKHLSSPLQPILAASLALLGCSAATQDLWKRPCLSLSHGVFSLLVHALVGDTSNLPNFIPVPHWGCFWSQPWVCTKMHLQLVHMRGWPQAKGCRTATTASQPGATNLWDLPVSFIICRMKGVCLLPVLPPQRAAF